MTGPAADAAVECYTLRRANPFRGVVAVVKTPTGRSLSIDGLEWQLQVLARPPKGLWSADGHETVLKYFRFGNWSAEEGMIRVPLNPILDAGRMLNEGAKLVQALQSCAGDLPFPLFPELEHWLLDQDAEPLALLRTAVDETELDEMTGGDWSAGGRGEQPFVASSLVGAEDAPRRAGDDRHRHAEMLERQVRQAAGRRLNSQWFRREPNGALGLAHRAPAGLAGRYLPDDAFPPLSLRGTWADTAQQALVSDYMAWLSPYLLTLPNLGDKLRRELEGHAVYRALLVDAIWRLYPEILDQDLINRARVEARLRRASAV